MGEVHLGPAAEHQHRRAIRQRREQAGSLAGERLRTTFHQFREMIGQFPRTGTVVQRGENYEMRQFPVAGFVFRFVVVPNGDATIIDIRHGSMREPSPDALEQQALEAREDQS